MSASPVYIGSIPGEEGGIRLSFLGRGVGLKKCEVPRRKGCICQKEDGPVIFWQLYSLIELRKINQPSLIHCHKGVISKMLNTFKSHPQLFQDGGPYHIETSPLICFRNQWAGLCVVGTSVMKELRRIPELVCHSLSCRTWKWGQNPLSSKVRLIFGG